MRTPQVIGHRGAPGYRPENTLASFRLAIALGADAVETDVVLTADGVPVLRHERDLGRTTDGTGLRVEELTLTELKQLRAKERWPELRPDSAAWDGCYEIATLDELLLLGSLHPGLALHLELKEPDHDLESAVLASLRDHGRDRRGSGVVLSSFASRSLERLRDQTDLPLVQLVDVDDAVALGLGGPADGIGVAVPRLLAEPDLVHRAHRAGLGVTAWTVRSDAEVPALLDLGVDGLFTDHPDVTRRTVQHWARQTAGQPAERQVGAA